MRNHKVIGEILVPIEPAGPVRPAPNALVVEPESDAEVEVGDGQGTLSAPDSESSGYVVRVRRSGSDEP